ncbi:MAG: amino acid-binding protein [Denitrovibrio sp.]|nr:MAG: amino acid-binding protein [Denitrovibrio sp.]
MKLKQISVFIENQSGRLHEVAKLLGANGINIRALSLADTSDFGILRLIVSNPDKAYDILKEHEFTVGRTDVLAVIVSDQPGGLAQILGCLDENNMNVEYMYAFVDHMEAGRAIMIFRFDDADIAAVKLGEAGFGFVKQDDIAGL